MSKGFKNVLLIVIAAVVVGFRFSASVWFDTAFIVGILVMASVEGIYLLSNRRKLEQNEKVNELFYLVGIGIVLACKLLFF